MRRAILGQIVLWRLIQAYFLASSLEMTPNLRPRVGLITTANRESCCPYGRASFTRRSASETVDPRYSPCTTTGEGERSHETHHHGSQLGIGHRDCWRRVVRVGAGRRAATSAIDDGRAWRHVPHLGI